MKKQEPSKEFDPSGMATGDQIFGLPFSEEESNIIILPVPWEVTVSYRAGTARAPKAILNASKQVDLFDGDVVDAWKLGIFMKKPDKHIQKQSKELRRQAEKYLSFLEKGYNVNGKTLRKICDEINEAGASLKGWVKNEMREILKKKKLPALLGGDHSTPLGFIEALSEFYPEFGILQIDAHCDLREAYEGFEFSHASIMFNALKISQVKKMVQVGIRDLAQSEWDIIHGSGGRIKTFFDAEMKRSMFEGKTWNEICERIINELPQLVYISFDIDGLDPKLCPNTGTPVAGGLEFEQAVYLILKIVKSGRKIIGFDLNEVTPGTDNSDKIGTSWDANVGARMLYKLCNLMGVSNRQASNLFHDYPAPENPDNDELVLEINTEKNSREDNQQDKETGD